MDWHTIGFESQKNYFENLLKKDWLLHAYLLSGPEMIGKRKFAQEFCRLANPDSASVFDADRLIIGPRVNEGESKIYIDNIREVNLFISRKPLAGPYKFVIIDDADRLTIEASNALLKVLEEPPPYSTLFLVSSQPKQLLPTITSRCQEVPFLPHTDEVIKKMLASKKTDNETSALVTEIAGGRLGWAIHTIESGSIDDVRTAIRDFKKVSSQGVAERLQYAKKLYEKEEYARAVDYWLRWTHAHLRDDEKAHYVIKGLLRLKHIISQPQYNHRLALETFLLSQ